MARLLYALLGAVLLAVVLGTVVGTINGPVFVGVGAWIEALVPPRPAGETLDDRLVFQKRIMNRHLGTGF